MKSSDDVIRYMLAIQRIESNPWTTIEQKNHEIAELRRQSDTDSTE